MSKIIFTVLTAGFLTLSYHASKAAPSICKGQTEAICTTLQVYEGIPACNWIKERATASGNTVKAHCRGSNKSIPADAKKKEVTPVAAPSSTN